MRRALLCTLAGAAACDAAGEWRGWQRSASTAEPLDTAALRADSVLVGAGDIASCDADGDAETAALLDTIPGTVFTAGDNVYPYGSPANYRECYEPNWGRHKWRTRPAPGDHEHSSAYFAYFGPAAGPPGRGYYEYAQAGWQVLVVNTNLPLSSGAPQMRWLEQKLRASTAVCRIAIMHEPLFSSSEKHGHSPALHDVWELLHRHGVDVVVSGHSHLYERFPPMDARGRADPDRGVRLFVAGTGGRYLHGLQDIQPRSEVRSADTFGVLKFTLRADGYRWDFVPVEGGKFRDSGEATCTR